MRVVCFNKNIKILLLAREQIDHDEQKIVKKFLSFLSCE